MLKLSTACDLSVVTFLERRLEYLYGCEYATAHKKIAVNKTTIFFKRVKRKRMRKV